MNQVKRRGKNLFNDPLSNTRIFKKSTFVQLFQTLCLTRDEKIVKNQSSGDKRLLIFKCRSSILDFHHATSYFINPSCLHPLFNFCNILCFVATL